MPFQNVLFTNFVIQSRLETACLDTCGATNGAQMRSWSFCYFGAANQLATSDGQSISFSGQCLDAGKDVVKNGKKPHFTTLDSRSIVFVLQVILWC